MQSSTSRVWFVLALFSLSVLVSCDSGGGTPEPDEPSETSVDVTGTVTSAETGVPIEGASVEIFHGENGNTLASATTRGNGIYASTFTVETSQKPDKIQLEVTADGFEADQKKVDISSSVSEDFELTLREYTLETNTEGDGSITKEVISGSEEEGGYLFESEVRVTAEAAEGWAFAYWKGDVPEAEQESNPTTVEVNSDAQITATFVNELEGIVSTNKTLTASESPYKITSKVQIAYGTALTVEPGVQIIGIEDSRDGESKIEVFGDLLVKGNQDERVVLKDVIVEPGDNEMGEPHKISMRNVEMRNGALYPPGGSSYGSIKVEDSFLYDVGDKFSPIYVWYPVEDSYFERNIFYNSGRIDVGHDEANVYVRNNLFIRDEQLSNETGYAVENWAAYGNSKTVVEGNTFASTDGVAVSLPSGYNDAALEATDNYWGTTDKSLIESMIYDENDDLNTAGEIPYEPYLESPASTTPAIPDSLR
jgi:hypothetical protein